MSANARDVVVVDEDDDDDDDARMDVDVLARERRPFRRARRPIARFPRASFSCDRCGIFAPNRPARTPEGYHRDCCNAAEDGNLEELKHLIVAHGCAYDDYATQVAAFTNRVDILAWAYCNVGPLNGFRSALDIAEQQGHREATELLRFLRLNRYERIRVLNSARHAALAGGAGDMLLKDAMEQIWERLYGRYGEDEDRHAIVFKENDEKESTRAKELASEILGVIEDEKTALSNGAYVKLCAALRDVHELRVREEPKSLFDGVVFGPNRLPFHDYIYEGHR